MRQDICIPNKFIAFEGPDGVGKTTQIERLAARLRRSTMMGVETAKLPMNLDSGALRHLTIDERAVLMTADRGVFLMETVAPVLKAGNWMLVDRFSLSTEMYNSDTPPSPLWEEIKHMRFSAANPLTIVLAGTAEGCRARLNTRGVLSHEDTDFPLQVDLHQRYVDAARRSGYPVILEGTIDEVADAVWAVVHAHFHLGVWRS